jgi:hypothetical protein
MESKGRAKRRISVVMSAPLAQHLEQRAAWERCSVSDVVEAVLRRHLREQGLGFQSEEQGAEL